MSDRTTVALGAIGLLALVVGMAMAWAPLGPIALGAVLIWVASRPPSRPPTRRR